MGMYDTVYFTCPSCGKITEQQSKAGPCQLRQFDLKNAPLSIIADLNSDGKNDRLYCNECGIRLLIPVQFSVSVREFENNQKTEYREE